MSRFFLFRWYNQCIKAYPATTQIVTTATLMAAGDVIAQKVIEKKEGLDCKRVARFFVAGMIFVGPVIRTWYNSLDAFLPKDTKLRVVKMVALDQLVFAPLFIPGILTVTGFLNGQNCGQVVETIKRDTWSVIVTNWMIWPGAQFVNFLLIPLDYRMLFANVVALIWNIYLSMMSNQGVEKSKDEKTKDEKMKSRSTA